MSKFRSRLLPERLTEKSQLGRLPLLLRKAERDVGRCTLLADDGGGRGTTSRRLAIAPPDASHRSIEAAADE